MVTICHLTGWSSGSQAGKTLRQVQNVQRFSWELDRVTQELEKVMRRAYRGVRDLAREKKLDLRTAAFTLAIQRVGKAALSRTTVRENIRLD